MTCADRVAIVTGAAGKGMGRSIALTLAREGAKVVVNYRTSREMAADVVATIVDRGGEAVAAQTDIFEADGCRSLAEAAVEHFGQVDICVIGPGADWHPEPPDKLDVAGALADAHQELAPLFYLMPLVLPGMYKRRWGRLVGLCLHPTKLPPAYAYNAAKAARTTAFMRAVDEAWQKGVTVNVVSPGPITHIETLKEAVEQCDHGPAWQKRKTTSPQDVAEGVAFLCSDAARFVSGCEMPLLFH
jgi:NAD(P)-dependent dehydrogenase (short-subunit alcohol dehydrogenase family)